MTHRVYISGPMSGIKNYNAEAFDAVADEFRRNGVVVFNPADHDRLKFGEDILNNEAGDPKAAVSKGFNIRVALRDDLEWICSFADAIYMLRGWENSKGARAEHAVAVALGIKVVYQ